MMIKAAFLGFMALGISGHTASAATFAIENFNLVLRYDGSIFSDLYAIPSGDEDDEGYSVPAELGEDQFQLGEYKHLSVGDIVTLVATVSYPVPTPPYARHDPNGGSAPVCELADRDCTSAPFVIRDPNILVIAHDDKDVLAARLTPGDIVEHSFWRTQIVTNDFGRFTFSQYSSHFTVLENIPVLAPIPLPAAVLMLPAAIGAFAFFRRRKVA